MEQHKCGCGVAGWISLILVVIGGINWGLIGAFSFNLVAYLVGAWPAVERIVYIIVGLAALFVIYKMICWCKCCKACKPEGGSSCGARGGNNPQM